MNIEYRLSYFLIILSDEILLVEKHINIIKNFIFNIILLKLFQKIRPSY